LSHQGQKLRLYGIRRSRAGRLDASVAQLPYLVGKQAVEKVTEVLNGVVVDELIAVPTRPSRRAPRGAWARSFVPPWEWRRR
jgi:hypothetical protein